MKTIVNLYQFLSYDITIFAEDIKKLANQHELKGNFLLAREGINASFCGLKIQVNSMLNTLKKRYKLESMILNQSTTKCMPFKHLKIKIKSELVTFKQKMLMSTKGQYVNPKEWDTLLEEPNVLLIDTRNHFEHVMGSFKGAIDPKTKKFSDFPDFVSRTITRKEQKVALFCTGGIRCEKASAYLLHLGLTNVFHLKGGILNYLNQSPNSSKWIGKCFVFDQRIEQG